jgi:hypothetical protein
MGFGIMKHAFLDTPHEAAMDAINADAYWKKACKENRDITAVSLAAESIFEMVSITKSMDLKALDVLSGALLRALDREIANERAQAATQLETSDRLRRESLARSLKKSIDDICR